jgi:hypothetical protein
MFNNDLLIRYFRLRRTRSDWAYNICVSLQESFDDLLLYMRHFYWCR